ncbi:MAG: hypothetical protein J7494_12185 [Sphingobium sp.]|nr:hypothetical protein [Sphingobium sp.]
MKVLFYLPVVTPWWFGELIVPMMRALHDDAEIHVLIGSLWRNTGIEAEHLAPLADLDRISWHIVGDEGCEDFRTNGAAVPGLLDLVAQINPDLTLARSADTATLEQFPGTVRYIMEGEQPPFVILPLRILIEDKPFALGAMPAEASALADRCVSAFGEVWEDSDRFRRPALRADWRTVFGLPRGRPVLTVPLHYEHEENFYLMHSRFPEGVDLVRHLLRTLDKDVFLAVSDHPLNRRYVDRKELDRLILDNSERVALCQIDGVPGGASSVLAAHADAVLIEMSKSWSLAAHNGTPMIHIDGANPAGWLRSTPLSDPGLQHWPSARLPAADPDEARRYFCWHLGTRVFDPYTLTFDRLMQHVSGRVSDSIIESNAEILRNRLQKAA